MVALIEAGYDLVILDNLSNSSRKVLTRLEKIVGKPLEFVQGDVRDEALLGRIFQDAAHRGKPLSTVLHFAALKAVGESVREPLRYYDNNVGGTLSLLRAMQTANVKKFVFSSSATVYDANLTCPFQEGNPIGPINPYGWTKAMVERVLCDMCTANDQFSAIVLRYFNPIGAHSSGLIGEDPSGIPNNLFPFLTQVAVGRRTHLSVYGGDYPTVDGTGVRDYVHVMDLAEGHAKAVAHVADTKGFVPINLGTGHGTSVLQLVRAFERAIGRTVPFRIEGRRPGDLAESWADVAHASKLLGWAAKRDVDQMCQDGWRWQSANPEGYGQAG
ncbi:UDP-glucose 4-epimerase GalE [Pigmentiphaga daeguensis]|uniref:UDP-glucose 4-epimerase n=1 Tax=Pigmentiphaga daeguensis TaxID=414049 RepID=A0ABN1CZY9_9BURK